MKNILIVLLLCIIISCNTEPGHNRASSTATDSLVNSPAAVSSPLYKEGARLVAANDCLTCHKLNEKSIGPSYYEISKKYPFDTGVVENLAHAIIHGSKGLYGHEAMTPHPNITYTDAKVMASYILSLKDSTVTRIIR
jgi:cytochrome c